MDGCEAEIRSEETDEKLDFLLRFFGTTAAKARVESKGSVRSGGPLHVGDAESCGPAKVQKRGSGMVDNVMIGNHEPDADFLNLVHTE